LFFLGIVLAMLLIPAASRAAWVEDAWVARFNAPDQSMWYPGGPTGFTYKDGVKWESAPFSAAINLDFAASAGTVSGNVEGLLKVSYNDHLNTPGNALFEFQYAGIANESKLRTSLGGSLKIDETFGVTFPWWTFIPDVNVTANLINSNPILLGNTDFTYAFDTQAKGTAEFAPTIGSLGVDVVVAGVGLDFKVTQDAYFTPRGIAGHLNYKHLGTGTSGWTTFGAYDTGWVQSTVSLALPGWWALSLTDISLTDNSFYTDIGLEASASIWATILGKASFSFGLDIYRNNPFALTFEEVDALGGSMLVYVDQKTDPDPVPEPGALWLLVPGLMGLIVRCRPRLAMR
jgi:hypothetical protein